MKNARIYISSALIVLGVLLTLAGIPALYVRDQIANKPALTNRLADALQTREVRAVAAEEATDGLINAGATDLLTVKPLLVPALEAFLDSPPVRGVVRLAAADAYDVIIQGKDQSLVLDLGTASAQLAGAVRSVSPKAARALPDNLDTTVLEIHHNEPALVGVRRLASLGSWGYVLPVLAAIAFASAIVIAPRRRLVLAWAGAGVALSGGLLALTLAIAKALTVRSATSELVDSGIDTDVHAAAGALWDSMLGDLSRWAGLMVVVGGIIVIVAGAVISPSGIANWLRDTFATITKPPPTRQARAARGIAAAVIGALVIADPLFAVKLLMVTAGGLLVFWGLAEFTAAIEVQGKSAARAPGLSRGRLALLLAGAALFVGAASAATIVVTTNRTTVAEAYAAPTQGCMGSTAMCDLRLSDVAIPATHNSFSAAAQPGWLFANQRYGIKRQLRDGIRGFLLDFHYGVRSSGGHVRTDLDSEQRDRNKVAKALDPQQLAIAERIAGRLGRGDLKGKRDVYLCHTVCELGYEPAVGQLKLIRDFLARNPGEIVEIFAEPYVTPKDIERVFSDAGLLPYVARLDRDKPLPTLGELVKSNQRLIVMTEHDAGNPDWYMDGFSFTQDTPLGVTKASQFSCRRERGDADSPLLLINHWIDAFPPRPSANQKIGGEFLRKRLARCAAQRKLAPNMVPVDFYDTSGVVKIVNARNKAAAEAATSSP
jgi:hypothetical protein